MKEPTKLTRSRAQEIASLDKPTGRRKHGQFYIEGWRSVVSAIEADAPLLEIIVRTDMLDDPRLRRMDRMHEGSLRCLPARTMAKLASVVHDQGILAVCRIPSSDPKSLLGLNRIVALDGVQDPGNVGTIVRSAAWFGFGAVVAGPETASFYNPKVVRSTAGAVWDVDLVQTDSLSSILRQLGGSGFEIAAADMAGLPLRQWSPSDKSVLVLGSEGGGLTNTIRDCVEEIGTLIRIEAATGRKNRGSHSETVGVESLNVAMAAGIIMHKMQT